MPSVFDERKIAYAIEKFGDFIHGSGSGAIPGYADAGCMFIIDGLQAFDEKLLAHQISAEEREYHVGTASYAICELQAFVTGDKTDIPNRKAARVYLDFLAAKLEKLREMERELDS